MFRSIRSKVLTAGAAALLTVGLVVAGVEAQGRPGGRGPMGPGGRGPGPGFGPGLPIGQLDLTDGQTAQLRDIMQRHRDAMRDAAQKLREARQAQRNAIETVPLSAGLVASTSEALAKAETDLAIVQAQIHNDVYNLLTDEQKAKATQIQSDREAKMKQRQQRRNR